MYAIFYFKIVEQVNVVRKYAPIPTDNFSTKLARPNMFKMQNKPAMWVLAFFNVVVAISSKLALSFQVTALLTNISQLVRTTVASLSFHLRLDPSFWRSWLQKHIWFQTSTRIHQTHRFRKKTTLESGFKSMRFRCADWLVSWGQKADSYKKVSGFVNEPVYVVVGLFYSGLWK